VGAPLAALLRALSGTEAPAEAAELARILDAHLP
jgi:hypothetical protein